MTVPLGPDGAPLWDVREWGTRGPPWRARLLGQVEPLPDDGAALGTPGLPSGERPGMRTTMERMERRIREHSPGSDARGMARACALRHDRRNGR